MYGSDQRGGCITKSCFWSLNIVGLLCKNYITCTSHNRILYIASRLYQKDSITRVKMKPIHEAYVSVQEHNIYHNQKIAKE